TCGFRFTGHLYSIAGSRDRIGVTASDAAGTLTSREVMARVDAAPGKAADPHLWAIIVGIARYQGERLQLRFSARDAEDFAAALAVGAPARFGAERVHVRVLTTDRE